MIRLGALLFGIVLPLSASFIGCIDCEDIILTEEFEDFCDGVPCLWEASGPVAQVSTYHAEIHGVAIPADTTLSALEGFGNLTPRVLVRCDEGATIEINERSMSAPSDIFVWLNAPEREFMTIRVSGTGRCVVDDISSYPNCY